jgi:ATP phosphoribosyltransferase
MNAIDSAREARSRNLARLRKLTIGTAALGVAATSGFGWLAAMTYTGAVADAATAYTTTATTGSATTSAAATPSAAPTATTTTVTSSSGVAHVSSGGS